jgi:hypothetical protein
MIAGFSREHGHAAGFVTERSPLDAHHLHRNSTKELLDEMAGKVREHPLQALMSALGLGILIGSLMLWGRK